MWLVKASCIKSNINPSVVCCIWSYHSYFCLRIFLLELFGFRDCCFFESKINYICFSNKHQRFGFFTGFLQSRLIRTSCLALTFSQWIIVQWGMFLSLIIEILCAKVEGRNLLKKQIGFRSVSSLWCRSRHRQLALPNHLELEFCIIQSA